MTMPEMARRVHEVSEIWDAIYLVGMATAIKHGDIKPDDKLLQNLPEPDRNDLQIFNTILLQSLNGNGGILRCCDL